MCSYNTSCKLLDRLVYEEAALLLVLQSKQEQLDRHTVGNHIASCRRPMLRLPRIRHWISMLGATRSQPSAKVSVGTWRKVTPHKSLHAAYLEE